MGLEGYLEDLGIRDILQILSLSKKSGTLTLRSAVGRGAICFQDGQVIRASSSQFPQGLGQLLRQDELITQEEVDEALAAQKTLNIHLPLGKILSKQCGIPVETIERVVAQQIEKIIFSFFSWTEGSFIFEVEELPLYGSALLNPLDFMLEKGLSPQKLALKGQKIVEQGADANIDDALLERELAELKSRQSQEGVDLLRGMLAELEHPELGGGVILLILRYASEIMSRAIIFDVRGRQLVGLGQFGLDGLNDAADSIVRKMRLNIEPTSLFAQVLQTKTAIRATLKTSEAELNLKKFLGGTPEEVFVGPLINDGKVIALLYGDNYPANQPNRAIDAFEVFLSRAGLAMEQALQGGC